MLSTLGMSARTAANSLEDFYKGRTITLVVGSEPGGTYDLYGRTIARHLGRFVPGDPKVIVQNITGAGSYLAARRVYSIAPQDGATIGSIGAALPYQPLIDPNSPPLDVQRINWLPSISSYNMVMIMRSDVLVANLGDLRARPTIQATIAPGQANSLIVAVVNEALGAKIKGVHGHKGLSDSILAMLRGEVDGYPAMPVEALKRTYPQLIAEGKVRMIMQFGAEPLPELPNVPYAADLASTPEDRMLIDLAQAFLKSGYVYMLGPDVPQDRVNALRQAFMAMYADSEFLEDAKKQMLNVAPVSAEKVTAIFAEAYGRPPAVLDRLRKIFRQLHQ
jgi:tripartite-type tricarboxylate transporter receptor subunit TctC